MPGIPSTLPSRREDVLDTVVALRRPSDHDSDEGARFEVHFEKSRGFYDDEANPFEAQLAAQGWITRDLSDLDLARVTDLTVLGMSIRDIAEELKISKSRVQRLQKKAEALAKGPIGGVR